jgi:hypothetical protein
MSRKPGPEQHNPELPLLPSRTRGPLGHGDAADPNGKAVAGDTPGPLGVSDGAYVASTVHRVQSRVGHSPTHAGAIPAQMMSSLVLGATIDAGVGKTGLFTYHVASGTKAETVICSEPQVGNWRKAVPINSVKDLAKAAAGAGYKISDLAILAHGDAGGQISLGDDTLITGNIGDFATEFRSINGNLSENANVYIYGCLSGVGIDGTVLLKELSKMLPKKKIVGFNVITVVKPGVPRKEGGSVFGNSCYDPNMWATKIVGTSQQSVRDMWAQGNAATPDAPQAKVALNGEIEKWPADEDKAKNDATKQPLKVDPEMMNLVTEWEKHILAEGRYTRNQIELYKWNKDMVDRFNAWLQQRGVKKRYHQ